MVSVLRAAWLPRSDVSAPIKFDLTGLGNAHTLSVVYGSNAAAPVLLQDFDYYQVLDLNNCTSYVLSVGPGVGALSGTVMDGGFAGLSGDNAWFGIMRGLAPATTDPLLAVVGPFVIDAA